MAARALRLALVSCLALAPGVVQASSLTADPDQPRPTPAPAAPATLPTPGTPATLATPAPPAPAQAPVQARPGWTDAPESPRTDQTVDVARGTRLVLSSHAGEVTVRAWDRDAVRVQASHSTRDRVDVQTADNTLRIRTRSTRGPGGVVDYTLTVPRWMAVNVSGTYLAATIEGTTAEVSVETVGGDLTLKGGSGTVSLRSIEGEIRAEGASGKLNASTVNDSITLTGVTGDVVAETVNGDVTITNAKMSSLEVSTVNGDVRFENGATDKGTYRVTTHQGDIRVSLGQQANATVFVRNFRGDFSSDFPVTLPKEEAGRDSNKRFNFTLGSGSARVELQSFQGDIHVSRGPLRTRDDERARRRERGAQAFGSAFEATLNASVEAQVEQMLEHFSGQLAPLMPLTPPTPLIPLAPLPPLSPDLLLTPAPIAPPVPPVPPAPKAPRP